MCGAGSRVLPVRSSSIGYQRPVNDRHFATVARGDGEHGGVSPTSALTRQRDSGSVDTQFIGVGIEPFKRCVILFR